MVKWIMTCVSTTAFTVNISREMHGYFKGGTGLRQGDPLSPCLFTLVMEVFTLIIARKVKKCKDFKYYFGCKELSLTHMCFANDLLVICHGDVKSVKGGTGLRQGDPLSPYLFTLVMEVFTLIIARKVKECKDFKYYFGCKDLSLTHMCFANDLLVICHGDVKSVKVIEKVLTEFNNCYGLLLI
ncbi:RNA-directed DNA polymerase, eukaryota, reverse transcriptase zinc-binding domain protein [Tanacetum coccineum]